MNSVEDQKSAKIRRKVRIVIYYLLIVIMTDYLVHELLFIRSLVYILWAQKNFPFITKFSTIISFFGSDKFFVVLLIVFYNFVNNYKTFILVSVILVGSYTANFLKMIYLAPRPYWVSLNIEPIACEGGWGNPSGHALNSTLIYLTIWKIIFANDLLKEKKFLKMFLFVNFICFIILIMVSRIILGLHSIDQSLFGSFLGLAIYYILFHIVKPNLNNPQEFFYVIQIDDLILLCLNIVLFTFTIVNYFGLSQALETEKIFNVFIDHECPSLGYCKRFENDALIGCINIHILTILILSLRQDYNMMQRDLVSWVSYNFSQTSLSDYEHFLTFEDAAGPHKEMVARQWNHTGIFTSLIRLILSFCILFVLMIPYILVDCNGNIVVVLFFKFFVPLGTTTFLFFTYVKVLWRDWHLTNEIMRGSK
jgi:membrane-associated phospholipid phosphatase